MIHQKIMDGAQVRILNLSGTESLSWINHGSRPKFRIEPDTCYCWSWNQIDVKNGAESLPLLELDPDQCQEWSQILIITGA